MDRWMDGWMDKRMDDDDGLIKMVKWMDRSDVIIYCNRYLSQRYDR